MMASGSSLEQIMMLRGFGHNKFMSTSVFI